MSRRKAVAAVIACCWVVLLAAAVGPSVPALAVAGPSTATAPQQLVNQYPLGPKRLCCNGQPGVNGPSGSRPHARVTHAGVAHTAGTALPPGEPVRHGARGGLSAVLLIGLAAAAALLVAGTAGVYRSHRRPAPALTQPPWLGYANGQVGAERLAGRTQPVRGNSTAGSHSPPDMASVAEELDYRRLDDNGDSGGAFNLGVVLHQRGDVPGAMAAYQRAEERGDPDAAFNLGVLLYETRDLDGAEAAWRRSAASGHVRAATNLLFVSHRDEAQGGGGTSPHLPGHVEFDERSSRSADQLGGATGAFNLGVILHQRGDVVGATAAYERAEESGDPDAAFNLGVLLYESGDLDGAEAAWRRSASHGHPRAIENLDFLLLRHRRGPERAWVTGGRSEKR